MTNISTFLPCLCCLGKKARNDPVLLCDKNVRPSESAAVMVSLDMLFNMTGIALSEREGQVACHVDEALSYRVSMCVRSVDPRAVGGPCDAPD